MCENVLKTVDYVNYKSHLNSHLAISYLKVVNLAKSYTNLRFKFPFALFIFKEYVRKYISERMRSVSESCNVFIFSSLGEVDFDSLLLLRYY